MTNDHALRRIKSFVLRAGRLSPRQKLGLETWLPDYQLTLGETPWDLTACFGRSADVVIELGFGMGQTLITMAQASPHINFLGIEVHQAGIGSLAAELHDHAIQNVRIAPYDAVDVLQRAIAPNALSGINIFFPDPWPKARHHKRRLIQPDFINLVLKKIKPGGFIHLATDWQEYAMHMLEVLAPNPDLLNKHPGGGFIPRPESRPLTKFEQRGMNLGHEVWDLLFTRK
ncbi:MAG: tRNA (guanosine(46)-N7)-methyltransferase TrmB [Legionella sp.]|nr:MAG: tRNA (guanosine(46)-N7)-methyltransferase TrmB [Legionella sp.]